jgi:putative ABC transport system permease protein
MLILTLKGLWAHKLRYALTALAVTLGVAFMAGTMVLTDTMKSTFDGVFESATEGTDVIVQRPGALDGDFESSRARLDASVVDDVAATEGVRATAGSIQGFAQLVLADGSVATEDGLGVTVGANWIDDDALNPFTLATGRAPAAADETVLDQQTAEAEGWALGDEVQVLTAAGPRALTLVGTATFGAVEGVPGSSLVATTDETAQALFAEPGRYDNVLVAATPGVAPADLADRIVERITTGDSQLEAITSDQDTADKQADFAEDLAFFNTFLMAFAYIALFVGTFIIYNTFSIVVAQRVKDMALLRAIGARRGQVLRSVLLEAVVVGMVAAGVGLVAGIALSFGLRGLLASVGLEIPDGTLVVTAGTVITAFAVGLAASVLSAVVPALRASGVRPIAALREVAIDRSGVSVTRVVCGLAITAVGVVSFAAGVTAGDRSALTFLGVGAVVIILGTFTLGPVLVRPAVRALGAPLATVGVTGAYARENARRSPKRTAATASALMIGVALVGFITILASSTSASIEATVDESFRSDYVIDSGSWDRGFATSIEDDLRAVPEVDTMSPLRSSMANVDGSTTGVMGVDTAVFDGLYDLSVSRGELADVTGDSVAVTAQRAEDDGLALGDTVPFEFADGTHLDLAVRAIYDTDVANSDGDWLLDLDTFAAHVTDQYDRMLYVATDAGVTAEASRSAIDAAVADWPNASVLDQAEFKESVTAEIKEMLNLIYGLLALAVVISLIGIANTLALSVHERTRELGMLRAVGMHRRQLRRAVRWEALLISALGAGLGAILAIGGAWGIVQALDSEGVTQMVVPVSRLAVIVGLAGLAGVLAASGPARRAAKLDILGALASE